MELAIIIIVGKVILIFTLQATNISILVKQTSFFFFNLFYLFIFGCSGSSLLRTSPLQPQQAGATLHRGTRTSHCGGLSRCTAWAPGARASAVAARGLSSHGSQAPERRLSSCGARAQPLCGTWDPPRPGPEPVSPALAGGLPTTAPSGKPRLLD